MNIIHAAKDLATAQTDLADAQVAAEKCADTFAALNARMAEKQQALNSIQQRRLDGGECETDGPTIALLRLDIDGLRPLVDRAQEQRKSAVESLQAAQIALQKCQASYEKATAESAAQALEARLHELEGLLVKGLNDLYVLKQKATNSPHVHSSYLFQIDPRLIRFAQNGVLPR